jgi:hypothetical protein
MKKECIKTDALFFLGKTDEEELTNNFDRIYDLYKFLAKRKGYFGDIKFVESLESIYIYVKVS